MRIRNAGRSVRGVFVGVPTDPDSAFARKFRDTVAHSSIAADVALMPNAPHAQLPKIFNVHTVFVNATPSGAFDKTILEAMACETLTLTSSADLKGKIDERCIFNEGDAEDLAEKIKELFDLGQVEKIALGRALREYVVRNHSLATLASRIQKELEGK